MLRTLLTAVVLAAATPAPAQDLPRSIEVQHKGGDTLDCYCRARGQFYAPGETICLRTAQGNRMALCRMEINVMSWGITESACPES
jgi:hypothetical protein